MSKKTNAAKQQKPRKPKVSRPEKRKRRNAARGRVVELKPSAGLKTALNDQEFMTLLLRTICRYIELTIAPGTNDAEFEAVKKALESDGYQVPLSRKDPIDSQSEKTEN
jgi:hypothetical protein